LLAFDAGVVDTTGRSVESIVRSGDEVGPAASDAGGLRKLAGVFSFENPAYDDFSSLTCCPKHSGTHHGDGDWQGEERRKVDVHGSLSKLWDKIPQMVMKDHGTWSVHQI
jgi:hypothetical protein